MAASALSFSASLVSSSLAAATASRASVSAGAATASEVAGCPLRIEAAHHPNKKATKKHNHRRPKKLSMWDRKRGGTKDYGPWPEAPPAVTLEPASPPTSNS